VFRSCLVLFLACIAPAQAPQLLADVNPAPGVGSNGGILCHSPRQPELLLALDDGVAGRELWRTDGTAAGTSLLFDLSPGLVGLGLPAPVAVPIALSRFVHFDVASAIVIAVAVPGSAGAWSGGVGLPSQPGLVGLDLVVQPVFLPAPLPPGFDVGDAFWLSVGF
jgi:ELWxxDGT repeat protein